MSALNGSFFREPIQGDPLYMMTTETCELYALNKLNELQYVYIKYNMYAR